ncbi:MAG: hypothetical protein NOOUEUKL_000939 [Candidatus Fervidibacter sp.]|jgi:hypothetical protein
MMRLKALSGKYQGELALACLLAVYAVAGFVVQGCGGGGEADNHNRNRSNRGKRCKMSADPSVKCSPNHLVVQVGEVSLPGCGVSLGKRLAPM